MTELRIAKLTDNGVTPTRATPGSAGLDLYSAYDHLIPVGHRRLCKLDLAFEIPFGYFGHIASRSGLALKHGVEAFPGTLDNDYRGNVSVLLRNMGGENFVVKQGDRIAQLIILPYAACIAVKECLELETPHTERAGGGFGSTGVS